MKPNDGPSFGIFSILLFHHTMILLLQSFRAASELDCSHQPIVALAGDDVILQCQLQPAVDASSETLMWTRPGLDPKYIHVHHDGRLMFQSQNPSYYLRTALFVDQLMNGNVSLKLFSVKLSDAGQYHCIIDSKHMEASVQLIVGAASTPVVNIAGHDRFKGAVVLQCESTGWYPEPEVFWLDAEGNLLSAGPTETVRGPDDLYTVSSRVTVEKRHSNSFTCRVQQKKTNQTRETLIHVPDDFFAGPSGSGSSLPVIIGLILSIVFVLAAAVVVWKWRQNKIRNKKHHEDEERRKHPEQELLMGPETDGKQPTEETDTVHNVDEFRAETGLQTETDEETLQREANNAQCADSEGTETQSAVRGGRTARETETGLDKSQEETETQDAPLPTDSDQKNKEDETKSVSDNTEKLREERQTESNLQSEEEDNIQSTTDKKVAQCLKKKDKHEDQPVVETVTTNVQENEEATGLQTLIDSKTLQQEANNAQCADSEGTETQSAARGGQTRETETGLDKSQEETETEAVTETASLNPVSTNLNNTEETQTGTMVEERQKDNNQQTKEEEEEQHGDQPAAGTVTPDVHKDKKATGPQTDGKTPQTEANKAEGADSEGTEQQQSAVRGGQTDQLLAEGGTENGSDKSQNETETQDAPLPTDSDQKNRDETESVRDNIEKLREERQKDNNQQTEEEEEEEKIKCAGDETGAQSLTEEDKHGEQQTAERETLRDREEENLKKKLKTKEREEETLEKQVSRYEGQVKDKEKQINEVRQQLEEVERQTEEAERKMRSVKKEDKDYKRVSDLNKKKEELQEQLKKFETILEEIKKKENNVRQKKLKATTEKEEIIMKLKELEMQRNQRSHSEDGGTVQ